MNRRIAFAVCLLLGAANVVRGAEKTVLEAERYPVPGAACYRDDRASGERCVGLLLGEGRATMVSARVNMPPGDYVATFWMEATPADVIHYLDVQVYAGDSGHGISQIQFDPTPGYQPFGLRFFHKGGPINLGVSAKGGSGFDGMRRDMSEEEKQKLGAELLESEVLEPTTKPPAAETEEVLDELEEDKSVKNFKVYDHRLLCDRIEVELLRPAPVAVAHVDVDKVHYLPGETVKAQARVMGCGGGGRFRLVAEDVTELDRAREVLSRDVEIQQGDEQTVEFEFKLGDEEFGHELRCSLRDGDRVAHSASRFFGVSRDVYRVGITGNGGPQNMQGFTAERAAALMQANKDAYANYFERFAWAPCDYSNLAPKTELFWSGQTQYPGAIAGFKNLLSEAHKAGVKGITYGKSCAGGIEGFKTFQRHPEFFGHGPEGPGAEAFNVFYLERMLANDYNLHARPIDGGWQHWASLWTNWWNNDGTVRLGAQAIIDSVEMFGWDGVRWDGHFVGNQQIFLDMLNEKYPTFVHGYNISFANPASKMFMPPDQGDFHVVAKNHGMLMDESVRDWSHTNFSSGLIHPFYEAICREADYEKRIGGLPLFITFDMASGQDRTLNVLFGLAAGQRYTYMTSPGDFAFGPLPKFLTRYSAFVWDDTKLLAKPEDYITVKVGDGPKDVAPWWQSSAWLREMPDGRQQLLINMLAPPGYPAFCNRVQTPPRTLKDLTVRVKDPAGAKLTRAAHISPDLVSGHELLQVTPDGDGHKVVVPRLRTWSIVALEYEGAQKPAFPLTTPVEDATAVLEKQRQAAEKKAAEKPAAPPPPPPPPPYYRDYANVANADLKFEEGLKKPEDLRLERNGVLDVHHARGAFSWLNPIECAVGILGGGHCQPSWVDFVGFKLRGDGCMDEFPDSYEDLMSYDVLALDNLQSFHLGQRRRTMAAEFVRKGGGLLYFGGYFNLSLGADHNTYLAELIPVRIQKYADIVRDDKGMELKVEKPEFFGGMVDWAKPPCAFVVDTSPLKDGAEVLVSAGGHPAIVACRYGEGRVVAVLMNPHGDYPDTVTPYWQWSQWPKVLAACVRWAGEGSDKKVAPREVARTIDTSKPTAEDLAMEAFDLSTKEFTAKLREARVNMVDAESARVLLTTAVDNADSIEDMQLLEDVVRRAAPFFDTKFAPLGERLVKSDMPFLREAGYQILGLAGDPKYRLLLEKGLGEERVEVVRQALTGLARMADPASRPAVEAYLAKGSERLLAVTALRKMATPDSLTRALPVYAETLTKRIRLRCGRRSIHEDLYGGVSFKLTPAQRRRLEADYRDILRAEANAKSDLAFFMDSMRRLPDEDLNIVFDFLAQTENRDVLPLAYTVLGPLPKEKAAAYRQQMKSAKLPELRILTQD